MIASTHLVVCTENYHNGYHIACRNNNVPSISMTCDNPFFPVDNRNNIRSMILSFRRCWYVKMPNLTTPLGFVDAFSKGIVNTYWIRGTNKNKKEKNDCEYLKEYEDSICELIKRSKKRK